MELSLNLKGKKDGQTTKPLQSRSALPIKTFDSPGQLMPTPLLDARTGLPGLVKMPGSDNPGMVVASWGQRAPLTCCELLPHIYTQRQVSVYVYVGRPSPVVVLACGNY